MARRNRHRLEDEEDDEVTPDEIEEIELEAVLAADKKLNTIIAWLKHKYPIGGCAVHPTEHCFFNKLGHWNLDLYKLFVWAVEIKRRKATGTRPPILDPAFLDDMAEEPVAVSLPRGATVSNSSAALIPTPAPAYNPQALVTQLSAVPLQYAHYPVHGVYPGWQAPPFWPPQPYLPHVYSHPAYHATGHQFQHHTGGYHPHTN